MKPFLILLFASTAFGQSLASQDCRVVQHPNGIKNSTCVWNVTQPSTLAKIFLFRRAATTISVVIAGAGGTNVVVAPESPATPDRFSLSCSDGDYGIVAAIIGGTRYTAVYR